MLIKKKKKYKTIKTVPKSNKQDRRKDTQSIPLTHIHDILLTCLGTGTSIKNVWVKLLLWTRTSPLNKMIRPDIMQHPYTRDSKKKTKLATPKAELKHYNG